MIDWIKDKSEALWVWLVDLTFKYPALKLAIVSLAIVLVAAWVVKKFIL